MPELRPLLRDTGAVARGRAPWQGREAGQARLWCPGQAGSVLSRHGPPASQLRACPAGPLLTGDIRNLQTPGRPTAPPALVPPASIPSPQGSDTSDLLARLFLVGGQSRSRAPRRRGLVVTRGLPRDPVYHLGLLGKPTLQAATTPSRAGRQRGALEPYAWVTPGSPLLGDPARSLSWGGLIKKNLG